MWIGYEETIATVLTNIFSLKNKINYLLSRFGNYLIKMLFILRSEAFERNCRAVELTPDHVPDINVITGVLKGKNESKNQQVAGIIIF